MHTNYRIIIVISYNVHKCFVNIPSGNSVALLLVAEIGASYFIIRYCVCFGSRKLRKPIMACMQLKGREHAAELWMSQKGSIHIIIYNYMIERRCEGKLGSPGREWGGQPSGLEVRSHVTQNKYT